jgi:outer membrane receptor for ferric coprogen and ferric-rhodotorulic acid
MPSGGTTAWPGNDVGADMAIYDRVEVLKGATGLMTGNGNPGATINLIRKKPTRTFQGYTTLSAGSWNDYRGELDLSGPLNESGTVRGRFVTAYRDRDSYLDRYHRSSAVFYGILEADLTPDTMLTIGADYQNDKPIGVGQSRNLLFDKNGDFSWTPRSFNPTARWSRLDEYKHTIFTTLEHRFENGWLAKLRLQNQVDGYDLRRSGLPNRGALLDPIDGSGVKTSPQLYIGDTVTNAADFYATGPFELFGRRHELVFGGTISNRKWNGEYAYADAPIDIPNYYTWDGNIPEPNWSSFSNRGVEQETIRQSGIYATSRLNLHDRFKLIVGSRIANYEKLQSSVVQMRVSNVIVPYVGAIYDLNEYLSAYASYTDIFQPQSVKNEQGNTLDPQTGKNYEAGLKGEFFDKRLNASAAYFIIQQDNYPIATGGTTPSGGTAYRPVDGVRTEGFELEVSGHLTPNWQLHAGFTHRISRRDGIKVATLSPENQYTLYATYKFDGALTGLTLGGGARWLDKTWDTASNPAYGNVQVTAPSYWVVDAMASYKLNDKLTATLNVRNLFDEKYYQIYGYYGSYTWGAPRSVLLSMKYTF